MGITSNTGTAGAKITKNGSKYSVLSGATLTVEGAGTTVTGALVSGFGRGSENQPGAVPGVSGGTDHPASCCYRLVASRRERRLASVAS